MTVPCIDQFAEEEARRERDVELRMLRAVACGLMRLLETQNTRREMLEWIGAVDWKEAGVKQSDFTQWWKNHKAADAARRAHEAEEARRREIRDRALAKLSKAEQKALGLD